MLRRSVNTEGEGSTGRWNLVTTRVHPPHTRDLPPTGNACDSQPPSTLAAPGSPGGGKEVSAG